MPRASFTRAAPDVRRQSLIEACARVLAARGVGGASVRTICREAGVSAGLLTHYFAGIDALIAETYRDTGARVAAAMDEAVRAAGDDPRARLEAYVTASFRAPILDPELLATWVAFWSLVKSDPAVAAAHAEIYAASREAVQALVVACLGERAGGTDLPLAAVAITALIDGLWLELCLDPSTFGADRACAIMVRWLDALLGPSPGA